MRKTVFSIFFILFLLMISKTFASASFASAEHIAIGDEVKLFYSANDPGQAGKILHLPNGLEMTYGDIIAFGDLYGNVGQPISRGVTEADRQRLFLSAFNAFARSPAVILEATELLKVMHHEKIILEQGLKNGETSEEIYQQIGEDTNRQYNCITGGGCAPHTWALKPGRFLLLAENDYDHFGDNALIAYKTGHELAEQVAIAAHETNDLQMLELAYAMNAFASHFLSDRFAVGHIRTPRIELTEKISPSIVGTALSTFMHNEENAAGLHVSNAFGYNWYAYGDCSYFNSQNETHRYFINFVMQGSVRQVFDAYRHGFVTSKDEAMLMTFIPNAIETKNNANLDISSLFYWDEATHLLMRRTKLNMPFDRHWTANWWSWATLIELQKQKKLTIEMQALLLRSKESATALAYGLITDQTLLSDANAHST